MRFLPHTEDDIARMLDAIGVESVDDLFETVPEGLKARAALDLPRGLGEADVRRRMESLAARTADIPSFQGAGCYRHFVPAAVSAVMGRAEFATAEAPGGASDASDQASLRGARLRSGIVPRRVA